MGALRNETGGYHRLRARVHAFLEGEGRFGKALTVGIASLIILNVAAVILASEPALPHGFARVLYTFELASIALFSVEYLLRVWSCVADARYGKAVSGRLRYAVSPLALVDLLAILPFFLPLVLRVDLRFIRIVRLLRLIRVFKLGRYSDALTSIGRVVSATKEQLAVAVAAVLMLLILAAGGMYYFEHDAQPKTFSSIPASMWWGVVTLATVGYGDVYPITTAGKVFAAVVALIGIGLFALPAGILASGFAEEMKSRSGLRRTCPYCGSPLDEPGAVSAPNTGPDA